MTNISSSRTCDTSTLQPFRFFFCRLLSIVYRLFIHSFRTFKHAQHIFVYLCTCVRFFVFTAVAAGIDPFGVQFKPRVVLLLSEVGRLAAQLEYFPENELACLVLHTPLPATATPLNVHVLVNFFSLFSIINHSQPADLFQLVLGQPTRRTNFVLLWLFLLVVDVWRLSNRWF